MGLYEAEAEGAALLLLVEDVGAGFVVVVVTALVVVVDLVVVVPTFDVDVVVRVVSEVDDTVVVVVVRTTGLRALPRCRASVAVIFGLDLKDEAGDGEKARGSRSAMATGATLMRTSSGATMTWSRAARACECECAGAASAEEDARRSAESAAESADGVKSMLCGRWCFG